MKIYHKPFIPPVNRTTWRVGISPWAGLKAECLTNQTCNPGLEIEFLRTIATLLNANLEFVETKTLGCGSGNAKGEWTGLMGMLQNDEIDITGNTCSLDQWRIGANFSSFSFPILQDKQNFLIKVPKSKYGFAIGGPFELSLWEALMIFMVVFFFVYTVAIKLYLRLSVFSALRNSFSQMISVISGVDNHHQNLPMLWFMWTSFVGYFLMLYNMYITGILFQPIPIDRPFENNEELAEKLLLGDYKIIDYHLPRPYPACFPPRSCDLFSQALAEHGYHFQNLSDSDAEVSAYFSSILSNKNLVYIQSKQYIDFFLSNFHNKTDFWLLEDDTTSEKWYTYYIGHNFPHKRLLYNAIILVGDFRTNIYKRHWKSSELIHTERQIKGTVSQDIKVSISIMSGPFIFYAAGILFSAVILFFEYMQGTRSEFLRDNLCYHFLFKRQKH